MVITNTSIDGLLVDDIDADLNQRRWSLNHGRYARRSAGRGHQVKMHRIIMARMLGRPLTRNDWVDHINGNSLDNRRSNLRLCTHTENMHNMRNRKRNKESGLIGVRPLKPRTWRWQAWIMLDHQQIHIGMFDTPEEAAWMRDQYALALHGEFAVLNFDYLPVDHQT